MAAPPDAPPSPTDGKVQNPVLLDKQPSTDDRQDTKVELVSEISPPVFVNSEPIREEQVQNAVKFLSHPKVKGSPVIYRRSFLEKKGLTKEEIDEAFRRVPDPTPVAATTEPVVMNQGGQVNSLSNVQQKAPTQIMQPTQIATVGTVSRKGTFSRFHWAHALVAVGFLIVSGAGSVVFFKKTIIPRLKAWVRKVVMEDGLVKKKNLKPSVTEEVTAAAKAAATAAGDVAHTIQEMMISKSEEKRCFEELINMLNIQVREMKSMSKAIQKLEGGQSSVMGQIAMEEHNDSWVHASSKQPYVNGKADADPHMVRSMSPPAPVQPSIAPHPKSYMEILNMIQRGEKPSNIREINDAPPNPNQPLSNPRLAPKPKPWEVNQANSNTTSIPLTQAGSNGSSHEFVYKQYSVDNGVPWWQRSNVRITEIEGDSEKKVGSSNVLGDERPVQQSWVPPQPPPIAMPEAAAAIRQPKKPAFQNEELTDDQSSEMSKITEPGDGSLGLNLSEMRREEAISHIGSSD